MIWESRGNTILYRLSPLSESKVAIDTQLETVDTLSEEIVSPFGNKKELTNSAAAAMAIARDEKHYGILAIRGK